MIDGIPTTAPPEALMTTAVTTPNQLSERISRLAEAAGVPTSRVSTRLTVDGTKLYASITCMYETYAEALTAAIRREATAEFGEQGKELTARREFAHVHVFLPVPKADAARGAQFLSTVRAKSTEF